MISYAFVLYCLLAAGGYLLVISIILDVIERKLRLRDGLPAEVTEPFGMGALLSNFVMEALFYVAVPTLVFSFFYFLIPFSGIRAGMAGTLFAFVIGAAPTVMGLSVRVKLPLPYVLFIMLSVLLKLAGCLTIVASLYSL